MSRTALVSLLMLVLFLPSKNCNAKDRDTLGLQLSRSLPNQDSEGKRPGKVHGSFSVGHALEDRWLLSLWGGFKQFEADQGPSTLFFIAQENLFQVRLYDPCFVFLGPRIYFLFPSQEVSFPPRKSKDGDKEYGAAGVIGIGWQAIPSLLIMFKTEYWSSVNSSRYNGTDVGLGFLMFW